MQHPASVPSRWLTLACGLALFTAGATLIILSAVLYDLKVMLLLRNLEVGWIGGAAFIGFAAGYSAALPLLSRVSLSSIMVMAAIGHLAGVITFFADTSGLLVTGALLLGAAHGIVEAGGNTLAARRNPSAPLAGLLRFHAWFSLGIVCGGLAVVGLATIMPDRLPWSAAMTLIAVPTLLYAGLLLFTRSSYVVAPATPLNVGQVVRSPILWLLVLLMVTAAILEFGILRWVPPVINAGDLPGTEIVAGAAVVAVLLRLSASRWLTATRAPGILLLAAILAGGSLYGLSEADTVRELTIYCCGFVAGTALLWPSILGLAATHLPQHAPAAMGLLATTGMIAVGLVAVPLMGQLIDAQTYHRLPDGRTLAVLNMADAVLPEYVNDTPLRDDFEGSPEHIYAALAAIHPVIFHFNTTQALPPYSTSQALRAIIRTNVPIGIDEEAHSILGLAESEASRKALRSLIPSSAVLAVLLGAWLLLGRRRARAPAS